MNLLFTKQIRFAIKNNKLTVKEINLTHENHSLDEVTYNHYPENMRIDAEQLESVEKMIELGANKHKLKAHLMKDGKTNVALKTLHNIQRKVIQRKEDNNDGDVMQKLLERLQQVPNARIRVVTSEESELIGNYAYSVVILFHVQLFLFCGCHLQNLNFYNAFIIARTWLN